MRRERSGSRVPKSRAAQFEAKELSPRSFGRKSADLQDDNSLDELRSSDSHGRLSLHKTWQRKDGLAPGSSSPVVLCYPA